MHHMQDSSVKTCTVAPVVLPTILRGVVQVQGAKPVLSAADFKEALHSTALPCSTEVGMAIL